MVQILEPGGVTVGKTLLKLHTERPYDSLLLDASAKKALRTTTTRKIRLMHCCSYLGSVFSEQFLSSSWTPELAPISSNFKLEAQVEHQSEDGLDSLLSAGASVFQAISESICLFFLVIFIRPHRSHGQSMKLWRHCRSFQTTPPAVKTRSIAPQSPNCCTQNMLRGPWGDCHS